MSSFADDIVADIKSRMVINGDDLDNYAESDEAAHIKNAADYEDAVWEHIQRPETAKGAYFPWTKTRSDIRHRPGEFTLYSGKEGTFKSMLTGMVHLGFAMQGQSCVIASMEMTAEETLERLEYQALGTSQPTREYHREFYKWADGRIYIYEQGGVVSPKRLIGLSKYAINHLGINNVLIDSLMTVDFQAGSSFELIEKQTSFVRELVAFAKSSRGHISLIAHLKKTTPGHQPTTDDIDGSKKIPNLAQNIFFLTNNLKKETEITKPTPDPAIAEDADVFLKNVKTRQGKKGSFFKFWLHEGCLQLTEDRGRVMPMIQSQIKTKFT